eukprot:g578.t1
MRTWTNQPMTEEEREKAWHFEKPFVILISCFISLHVLGLCYFGWIRPQVYGLMASYYARRSPVATQARLDSRQLVAHGEEDEAGLFDTEAYPTGAWYPDAGGDSRSEPKERPGEVFRAMANGHGHAPAARSGVTPQGCCLAVLLTGSLGQAFTSSSVSTDRFPDRARSVRARHPAVLAGSAAAPSSSLAATWTLRPEALAGLALSLGAARGARGARGARARVALCRALPYGIAVLGTGSTAPETVVSNDDLSEVMETTDEWITQRTGIRRRHVLQPEESLVSLSVKAAKKALKDAQLAPEDVDLLIHATSTPDDLFGSGPQVASLLGAERATAFDLTAACSGFVFALVTAAQYVRSGAFKNVLVVGADCLSRFVDWSDRSTCVLFGDGAGAMVITQTEASKDVRELGRPDGLRQMGGPTSSQSMIGVLHLARGSKKAKGTPAPTSSTAFSTTKAGWIDGFTDEVALLSVNADCPLLPHRSSEKKEQPGGLP